MYKAEIKRNLEAQLSRD